MSDFFPPRKSARLPNYFVVTVDLSSATWNTVASHEVVTVTGDVYVEMFIKCTETVTDVSDMSAAQVGVEGDTDAFIGTTSLSPMAGESLTAGRFWRSTTLGAADAYCLLTEAVMARSILGGLDIGYEITSEATSNGTLEFHVYWEPILGSTGTCAAGAGGSL